MKSLQFGEDFENFAEGFAGIGAAPDPFGVSEGEAADPLAPDKDVLVDCRQFRGTFLIFGRLVRVAIHYGTIVGAEILYDYRLERG